MIGAAHHSPQSRMIGAGRCRANMARPDGVSVFRDQGIVKQHGRKRFVPPSRADSISHKVEKMYCVCELEHINVIEFPLDVICNG